MPHLLHRPGNPRRVIAPAAAVLLLLLAGCASSHAASTTAADTVQITGAGSTFDAPFFDIAFPRYQQAHPGVTITYAAVGSSAGITAFTAGKADFGASDVPASPADLAGARGGPAVQVPVDLGAVVIAYNLPGGPHLKLTGPVAARIFLGQITRWDDPAITALNPGITLPDMPLTVIHRSDGSGTSYIFTDYLTQVSPAWAARVGAARSPHWPTGQGASGNDGVATTIARTTYSLGYVESAWAYVGPYLSFAAIANSAGNYVTPTPAAITAAAADRPDITPASFSIVNQPGPGTYPICGYSWILLSARQPSQAAGRALIALVTWLTGPGQASAASLGYVPLPAAVQQYARTALASITGPGGTPLTS